MSRRLLVIEDDSSRSATGLSGFLRREGGYECKRVSFPPPPSAPRGADLMIPVAIGPQSGLESIFHWITANSGDIPSLLILPQGVDDNILRTAAEVSDDFLLWPAIESEVRQRISRLLWSSGKAAHRILGRLAGARGLGQLVGADPAFLRIVELLPKIAASDMFVLISGETGTGKDLFARAIHHLSRRAGLPFVPADCGALPGQLLENELFGHVRGAFTDARADQKGLVALAGGGTLFLDEVDALPLESQSKLLRFLQDGTYRRLGADRFSKTEVRVIAATNVDLGERIARKKFRSDLYFRLSVLEIELPALRERPQDIELLAEHCLKTLTVPCGRKKSLSPAAIRKLTAYDWPGNVRQLFNVVQRASVLCEGPLILPRHLVNCRPAALSCPARVSFKEAKKRAVEEFERVYIENLLRRCGGNVSRAARAAQKERRAFGRLVKKYGIDPGSH